MNPTYLVLNGQQAGPFSPEQLRQLITESNAVAETPAWQEGMAEWTTLKAIMPEAFTVAAAAPPPFVPPVSMPPPPPPAKKGMSGCLLAFLIVCGLGVCSIPILGCLAGIALGPITAGIQKAKENMAMQQARAIELLMFEYSVDHNDQYPTGKTSAEVFQKLIDEKYADNPAIFFIAMPGKIKPTSNTLTADNVCFDVTGGASIKSSVSLPLVFLTGYTVVYTAGATATCDNLTTRPFPAIAVAYKGNSSRIQLPLNNGTNGDIPHFVPDDFTAGASQYTQLRP